MNKPWDGIISQKDQEAYRAAGFGGRSGLGTRSGLLIIDSPACACDIASTTRAGSSADTQPAFPKY
jgi:hypothetical protein